VPPGAKMPINIQRNQFVSQSRASVTATSLPKWLRAYRSVVSVKPDRAANAMNGALESMMF